MVTSFASDIRPMFRLIDVEHMKRGGVLLDDFAYMSRAENDHGNARAVLETVVGNPPPMPPGGPYWTADRSPCTRSGWMRDFSPEERTAKGTSRLPVNGQVERWLAFVYIT